MKRRTRTTKALVVMALSFKELSAILGIPAGTIAGRYHRIKRAHPKSAVMVSALRESHKTRAHRNRYTKAR